MKNKDAFTLWGVQRPNGTLATSHGNREEARQAQFPTERVVKLECRIVPQSPKKPKTFTAHGLKWAPHKPGDPMPCEGSAKVRVILRDGEELIERRANHFDWKNLKFLKNTEIIGWNFAP